METAINNHVLFEWDETVSSEYFLALMYILTFLVYVLLKYH